MKMGQVGLQWWTHLKWWIQLMCPLLLREELQRIFLNNWEVLWVQLTKFCLMTLPFLRSIVVGFHQDNARLHIAVRTVEIICHFGWEQLPYPSFRASPFLISICLASSKNFWVDQFSNNEVKSTEKKWLKAESEDFYTEGKMKACFF